MTISSATVQAAPPAYSGAQAAARANTRDATLSSDFQTFLQMLTVQMQNQDPLNPIDSTEYAVQLATFSSVEQQVLTNDLLEGLARQMGAMGMAQLAGWVGMDARADAPAYFDGSPVSLSPSPARLADQAFLTVRDAAGAVVQRQEVPVSNATFDWPGLTAEGQPLATGIYSFTLESYGSGALLEASPVETYSRIIEARNQNGQTMLVMAGGFQIAAEDITALREDL